MLKRFSVAALMALAGLAVGCDSNSSDNGEQQTGSQAEAQQAEHHEGDHHGEEGHDHEGEGDHHGEEGHHHESDEDGKGKQGGADKGDSSTVKVAKDGTKFEPAVEVSRLPDGVWYCEMEKSHYASKTKGDGKCPVCGMKLKKK